MEKPPITASLTDQGDEIGELIRDGGGGIEWDLVMEERGEVDERYAAGVGDGGLGAVLGGLDESGIDFEAHCGQRLRFLSKRVVFIVDGLGWGFGFDKSIRLNVAMIWVRWCHVISGLISLHQYGKG